MTFQGRHLAVLIRQVALHMHTTVIDNMFELDYIVIKLLYICKCLTRALFKTVIICLNLIIVLFTVY